jgi:hypothetical protein
MGEFELSVNFMYPSFLWQEKGMGIGDVRGKTVVIFKLDT